ncbi:hypothetical protein M422DRAFT_55545 [Sphaerobolus stellatus SS14]|uniref:Uncharacterized protein n=1 Tax=Sphaerobolus stellatus (strain SS14) TaxID=990650 RepID=A0A0C9ULX0_SPHS4|nr:hypothetical protein M422DRAFT_55545 [Sphaerobolus stellatus SS14]
MSGPTCAWRVFTDWYLNYSHCTCLSNELGFIRVDLDWIGDGEHVWRSPKFRTIDSTSFAQSLDFMRYMERFHQMRQLLKNELNAASLSKYRPLHEKESQSLIKKLLAAPDELAGLNANNDFLNSYSGSIVLKSTYEYRPTAWGDCFPLLVEEAKAAFSEASSPEFGNWLGNSTPWHKTEILPDWMTSVGSKHKARAAERPSKLHREMIEELYAWGNAHQDSNTLITPNFGTSVLNSEEPLTEEQDNLLKWTLGSLIGG